MRRRIGFARHALPGVVLTAFLAIVTSPSLAGAMANGKQLLIGGAFGEGSQTLYTAPGLGTFYEAPASIPANVPMPRGFLSGLRVRCVSANLAPGDVTVTVMLQGQDTALTCSCGLTNAGLACSSPSGVRVRVENGQLLQVKSVSSQTGSDKYWFTYSFLFR